MKIALVSPKGPLYRKRGGIFGKSLRYQPLTLTTLAALETMYLHCPSCLEEAKSYNAVMLGGWVSSSYVLACREPIKTLAELKGKRVRATGGNADMLKQAGMVPVGATRSRQSACCSAAGSIASTAWSTGCAPSATPTSPST